jgi:hypothetical protein
MILHCEGYCLHHDTVRIPSLVKYCVFDLLSFEFYVIVPERMTNKFILYRSSGLYVLAERRAEKDRSRT